MLPFLSTNWQKSLVDLVKWSVFKREKKFLTLYTLRQIITYSSRIQCNHKLSAKIETNQKSFHFQFDFFELRIEFCRSVITNDYDPFLNPTRYKGQNISNYMWKIWNTCCLPPLKSLQRTSILAPHICTGKIRTIKAETFWPYKKGQTLTRPFKRFSALTFPFSPLINSV